MTHTSWLPIQFIVNARPVTVTVPPLMRLLDVLRENLGLTGTKEGCGEGECGSCSVRMNDQLVNSCLVPVLQASGATIETVEGLGTSSNLHPLQRAFLECGGAQCGMLMAATHLLKQNPAPSFDEIREGLAGNLCRCTGFTKIFDSVIAAAAAQGACQNAR